MGKKRGTSYSPIAKKKRLETSRETPASPGQQERSILNEGLVNLYKQVLTEKENDKQMKPENTENLKTPAKEKRRRNNAPVANLSTVTFDDVGGMDKTLEKVRLMFFHHVLPPETQEVTPIRGILLHGSPGCGKTLVARAIAGELSLPILEVGATELVNGISGESEGKIRETFETAIATGRCILFIDNIQVLCQKGSDNNMVLRMGQQLMKSFDDLAKKDPHGQVMVIGATNRIDSVDETMRGGERFSREVPIGMPDKKARQSILEIIIKAMKPQPDISIPWLAKSTPGYVGSDLKNLVSLAVEIGRERIIDESYLKQKELENSSKIAEQKDVSEPEKNAQSEPFVSEVTKKGRYWWNTYKDTPQIFENFHYTEEDFKKALKEYVPYTRKEGFSTVDNVTWEDIGALTDVKEALQESIVWPIKYSEFYESNKLNTPKGILLFGPKGCGKTLVAKAIANECNLNFLSVSGPELLSMYVGESERAIRNTFQRAQNSAPCVLFFDEFDALCPPRSSYKENAPVERVVNQLLCVSDGTCSRKEVFLVAATNRLDKIDSAMLRPGRLEMIYYVGLPSEEGRVDILRNITRKTQTKIADEALETIARDPRCQDFSGADLAYLVRKATTIAVKEKVKELKGEAEDLAHIKLDLNHSHFDEALNFVKPSISEQDKKYFLKQSSFCHGGTDIASSKNT